MQKTLYIPHTKTGKTAVAKINCFRPESSTHHPHTQLSLSWDQNGLLGTFSVRDQFVKSVYTQNAAPVYEDSCVEIFVQPVPGKGYFNFEFNAAGAMLASYVTDPARTPSGSLKAATGFTAGDYEQVKATSSIDHKLEAEIETAMDWTLDFEIPFSLLERFTGALTDCAGAHWRANFFKCADKCSHPHWASWTRLPEKNFHLPEYFGQIILV